MLKVAGSIWIESGKGTYMGYGRMLLLEKINDCGSISEAAKSMKMSYKKAWEMIDSMNRQSKKPLVIRVSGGKGGGGSVLTEEGFSVIKKFKKLLKAFDEFSKKHSNIVI